MDNGKLKEQRIKEKIDSNFLRGFSAMTFRYKDERLVGDEQTKIHEWGVEVITAERPRLEVKKYHQAKFGV